MAWSAAAAVTGTPSSHVVARHPITLKIDGATIAGNAGCNHYGGKIEMRGSTIRLVDVAQTAMACADERAMAAEGRYTTGLRVVDAAARDGDALILSGPGVELRFLPAEPTASVSTR